MVLYHYSIQWLGLPWPAFGLIEINKEISSHAEWKEAIQRIQKEAVENYNLDSSRVVSVTSLSRL